MMIIIFAIIVHKIVLLVPHGMYVKNVIVKLTYIMIVVLIIVLLVCIL